MMCGRSGDSYDNVTYQTLIEHWNGTAWSIVPSPNGGSGNNYLQSVAAISANDVWAVGYYLSAGYWDLAERWDGTVWTISTLDPSISSGELLGVSALSSSDVWLAGYANNGSTWLSPD